MTLLAVEDITPLYKILCISLLILSPLLPAWILYKIAPKDRILAQGGFAGFTINATGAVAIYVVIFAAIYPKTDNIMKSIDDDKKWELTAKIKNLEKMNNDLLDRMPWKVHCKITLLDDKNLELDNNQYYTFLNPNYIQALPLPLKSDAGTRTISFYVDDDVLKNDSNSCSLIFSDGGFGAKNFTIDERCKNRATKEINVSARCSKNSSLNYNANGTQTGSYSINAPKTFANIKN